MDPNNVVHCDECLYYNQQFNDCKAKAFERIDNATCSNNCTKYSPKPKKIMLGIAEKLGIYKLLDFVASKLNH